MLYSSVYASRKALLADEIDVICCKYGSGLLTETAILFTVLLQETFPGIRSQYSEKIEKSFLAKEELRLVVLEQVVKKLSVNRLRNIGIHSRLEITLTITVHCIRCKRNDWDRHLDILL